MTLKELHLPSANYILEHIFGENIQVVNGRICWTKLGEKKGQNDFFFFRGRGVEGLAGWGVEGCETVFLVIVKF